MLPLNNLLNPINDREEQEEIEENNFENANTFSMDHNNGSLYSIMESSMQMHQMQMNQMYQMQMQMQYNQMQESNHCNNYVMMMDAYQPYPSSYEVHQNYSSGGNNGNMLNFLAELSTNPQQNYMIMKKREFAPEMDQYNYNMIETKKIKMSPQENINFDNINFPDLPANPPFISEERADEFRMRNLNVEKLLKKTSLLTDITPLLVLPQKIAAAKLGVSESMLCKRFKEVTNKKWPYRHLRRIERDLVNCTSQSEVTRLLKMKEEYLAPVFIRVRRYRTQKEIDDLEIVHESDEHDEN